MQQKLDHEVVMHLNVVIQDASEAIKAKVAKRLSRFPAVVRQRAANRASKMTAPKRIAQQASPILIQQLPESMREKGVTVEMKEIYQEGAYLVFRIRVVHVDPVILAKEYAALSGVVHWVLTSMGEKFQKSIEEDYLPRLVLGTLESELPRILKKEMTQKKIAIETKMTVDTKSQEAYFAKKTEQLKQEQRQPKTRIPGLVKTLHRRVSSSMSVESDDSKKHTMEISKDNFVTSTMIQ